MRLVFLLICSSLVLTACSAITIGEQDVFFPKPSVTPDTFDLEGVRLSDTTIAVAESVEVNAWHLTQPDARATTVLFFGGNGFYLVQSRGYLRALTRPPVNALLWDYRGYGRSEGTPSVAALRQDAIAVYDHLVARGVEPDRLLVWGHSLGSFLAAHVATERTVGGVVLENPATTVDDWVGHLVPWYVRLFLGVEVDPALRAQSNIEKVRALEAPLLVVAGGDDEVTDPAMARRLHRAAASTQKRLVVVEEGGHNGLAETDPVQAAYRELVERVAGTGDG